MKGISIVWLSKTDLTNLNAGEGETNYIDIKKFKKEGKEFPYVSGQAMRFYIKEAIRRNLKDGEYMCIPDDKGETCGNIKDCILCDLFGFMSTIKKGTPWPGYENGHPGGAERRISPVKVSPAIGMLPFDENAVVDFLTRRKLQRQTGELSGDIVNVEVGTNIYKCGISIDVVRVGGDEVIDNENRTIKIEYLILPEEQKNRIKKVLEALRYLTDYSKQARLLTDFTPDVLCIAFQNKYSHRLQKLFEFINEDEKVVRKLDVRRMEEILRDVSDYSDKILFGMISGIIENEDEVKEVLQKFGIEVKTPKEVIEEAIKYVDEAEVE